MCDTFNQNPVPLFHGTAGTHCDDQVVKADVELEHYQAPSNPGASPLIRRDVVRVQLVFAVLSDKNHLEEDWEILGKHVIYKFSLTIGIINQANC